MNFGTHPLNLLLRFILEMTALVVFGFFGRAQGTGIWRFVAATGLPLIMAIIWGVFAVPGDPSRSGRAPIPISGLIRLLIESVLFILAFLALMFLKLHPWAYVYGVLIGIHYLLSADRIKWLLNQKRM